VEKFFCLILFCALTVLPSQAAPAASDDSSVELTVDLRDGSRVIGKNLDDTLSFHSATLGDMKLSWAGIRAVEYTGDSDTAHLTAVNGDAFTVQLSIETLRLATGFGQTELPLKLVRSIKVTPAPANIFTTSGVGDKSGVRLTIKLRDGSQLVGKGLDEILNFHSTAMGDLKLKWTEIRSIEFAATDAGPAQLTAKNADVYEVQFAAPTIGVETSFGKHQLPLKLIQSIMVSTEGDGGDHLIGWWKLDEGTGTVAKDSSSMENRHDGTLVNGPQWAGTPDRGDASLRFNGGNQYISLGNIFQGAYEEISIASWIKHDRGQPVLQEIVERGVWDNPDGIALMIYNSGSAVFGHYQTCASSKTLLLDDQWHHVAGTMAKSPDGTGYIYSIYVDGKLDNTVTVPTGVTATSSPWAIGARYDGTWAYGGQIKDVRIYDRALSASEVQAIYEEGNNGVPPPPAPAASTQPVENTVKGEIRAKTELDAAD
jgi:hypothetical protein